MWFKELDEAIFFLQTRSNIKIIWSIWLCYSCREYQNMNTFFAIVMGLSNIAVSRMTSTWDRLNSKVRRTFTEFEAIIDPSRNHRAYRLSVAKMSPPIIPFMPLLMKDMTFTHEGNKTTNDGLVNFEKMVSHLCSWFLFNGTKQPEVLIYLDTIE